jgi:hypothetical protein
MTKKLIEMLFRKREPENLEEEILERRNPPSLSKFSAERNSILVLF